MDAGPRDMTLFCILAQSLLGPPEMLEKKIVARFTNPQYVRAAHFMMGKRVRHLTPAERAAALQAEAWVKGNMRGNLPEVPGITRLLDVFILNTVSRNSQLPADEINALIARALSKRTIRIARLILGQKVPNATARDRKDAANCRAWAQHKRRIEKAKEAQRYLSYQYPFDWE